MQRNPEIRIAGVVVENERHRKRLLLCSAITTIYGMIGIICLIAFIINYLLFT